MFGSIKLSHLNHILDQTVGIDNQSFSLKKGYYVINIHICNPGSGAVDFHELIKLAGEDELIAREVWRDAIYFWVFGNLF